MKKHLYIIAGILLATTGLIVYLNQHSTTNQPIIMSGTTMGTSYHIKLIPEAGEKIDVAKLKNQIDTRLAEIDHKMSTYKKDSELSRFNRHPSNQWMEISTETFRVIEQAQEISRLSDGAFDITVGNLVNLWGFGPSINIDMIPDSNAIKQLQQQIGYQQLQLQKTPTALKKNTDEIYLDLCAIAKGYAVDAIALLILSNNIDNFLVEIGGEIITHGLKAQQQPWIVGIESAVAKQRSICKQINLVGSAMATSGDYRNYFEQNGSRYSHTIDPRTGRPITHQLASVSVISDSCMQADALATALMVLGPIKGMEFANQHQLAIFMLIKQGDKFIEKQSSSFSTYIKQ
ncbi:MAG: FAD:protein FMN transferase [Thermodesulfobacteriota bacterium]|nr:FAD:protein FMN transferase [Thermodesulfobacteriota bacterium]